MFPTFEALWPLFLVITIFVFVASTLPRRAPWARLAIVAAAAFVVAHYLSWRISVTVLPADTLSVQNVFVWFVFGIEMLALLDAGILFATLLRRTDRTPEADAHEARLRAAPDDALPTVDVLIPTYNEPLDVLEKTITGATFLDWPADRLKIWVLDDKKRDWLKAFCAEKSVGYLTREGNVHAKAGNINAALERTDGEFFVIFDADFVPRRDFLFRTVGFFEDPKIGIVQVPHHFFNHDPMQANLALRRTLPDDQRLFFDEIMPGRDGWDCAFCCGSNSVTRRAALEKIGGQLPTESITEDMLLTLTMLREGYVTRFLNERLAVGLAPESLEAFFVQRQRWARGALQIAYLKNGPFGPGLSLAKRLLFLPTHWLTQSLVQFTAMVVPAILLLTGIMPLLNATVDAVFFYQIPALVAVMAAVRFFAPGQYLPLAATVLGVLQSFRLLPTVLSTLVKPWGHLFAVTPKGSGARGSGIHLGTIRICLTLLALTALGLVLNADLDTRMIERGALIPITVFWATFNIIILMIVAVTAIAGPAGRTEERFDISEPVSLRHDGETLAGQLVDLSLSGAQVEVDGADLPVRGTWLWMTISEVGELPAMVVRAGGGRLGVQFHLPVSSQRDRLIRRLFTSGLANSVEPEGALRATFRMIGRILGADRSGGAASAPPCLDPPQEIRDAWARMTRVEESPAARSAIPPPLYPHAALRNVGSERAVTEAPSTEAPNTGLLRAGAADRR